MFGLSAFFGPRPWGRFVLLRVEEYERLRAAVYDDSPWTREETDALAREAGQSIGGEEMDEYDRLYERGDSPLSVGQAGSLPHGQRIFGPNINLDAPEGPVSDECPIARTP
jgi:hypothetical protein